MAAASSSSPKKSSTSSSSIGRPARTDSNNASSTRWIDSAVLHGGRNFTGNFPLALQFELQRAGFVSLNRAGAQPCRQIGCRRQREPFAHARHAGRASRLGEHVGLKTAGLTLAPAIVPAESSLSADRARNRVGWDLCPRPAWRKWSTNLVPGSWPRKTGGVPPACIAPCRRPGQRSPSRAVRGGTRSTAPCKATGTRRAGAEDGHVGKLKPLGGMRRHQPDRILILRCERNNAAGLTEVFQIVQQLRRSPRSW